MSLIYDHHFRQASRGKEAPAPSLEELEHHRQTSQEIEERGTRRRRRPRSAPIRLISLLSLVGHSENITIHSAVHESCPRTQHTRQEMLRFNEAATRYEGKRWRHTRETGKLGLPWLTCIDLQYLTHPPIHLQAPHPHCLTNTRSHCIPPSSLSLPLTLTLTLHPTYAIYLKAKDTCIDIYTRVATHKHNII